MPKLQAIDAPADSRGEPAKPKPAASARWREAGPPKEEPEHTSEARQEKYKPEASKARPEAKQQPRKAPQPEPRSRARSRAQTCTPRSREQPEQAPQPQTYRNAVRCNSRRLTITSSTSSSSQSPVPAARVYPQRSTGTCGSIVRQQPMDAHRIPLTSFCISSYLGNSEFNF